MKKLVIVESPAKAKTITQFLGSEYNVLASFGHIRDLPESADDIPADIKKEPWSRLGVNVEKNFEPIYVVNSQKKKYVDSLKKALKNSSELLLATDEDREGESISWHILQLLKPTEKIPVKRIVFHEITPEALKYALENSRNINEDLVKAQEARRILDRLYGYTLSPLLWKKVAPKLSAGRVQSVAVKLTVEREKQRIKFHSATYWDLEAELKAENGTFKAKLTDIDKKKIANGKHFNPETGEITDKKVRLLNEKETVEYAEKALHAHPWKITRLQTSPGKENQPPPFMTSTLQQEASRKLRYTAKRTMQIAQSLYEGVDLGGKRIGLITYMRTDSLSLSNRALKEAREVIEKLFGKDYLPDKPNIYKTKSKNAQEAHEAIRPTDLSKDPKSIQSHLTQEQFALYELIWKRTLASQMNPAKIERTSVDISVQIGNENFVFLATGKQIIFPGFLKAYVEGSDDPEASLGSKETLLPILKMDQILDPKKVSPLSHSTRPPARYTEASLIKKLEEEGVGRPSTYASILSTIQDRGYINKKGNELIPTFTAFAVTNLLEDNFTDLINLVFTARMEDELDEISNGTRNHIEYLKKFYFGSDEKLGIHPQVNQKGSEISYPSISITNPNNQDEFILVKVGRFGPYVQRGDGGKGNVASIPIDIAPADLTYEKALELIEKGSGGQGEIVGQHIVSGQNILLKTGPYGNYLEIEASEEEKKQKLKPKRVSLPKGMDTSELTTDWINLLTNLPKNLGNHPDTQETILLCSGPYGSFVQCGSQRATIEDWKSMLLLNTHDAVERLKQAKNSTSKSSPSISTLIKDLSEQSKNHSKLQILKGRYGPYVTNGKVNATLPKDTDPENISVEKAEELIAAKSDSKKTKKTKN